MGVKNRVFNHRKLYRQHLTTQHLRIICNFFLAYNVSSHPHPIPTNIAQHSAMGQKTTPPIPTQPKKQPKTKKQPKPNPKHGMRKHTANPSPQRNKTKLK
jgi:hypothetical protein